ncbi:MAG: alpha/beta hydrolase fold domain-containing protein [Symbiopectobacterium sp.]|uniref:alpha/beta hydrolase fold domain-containing protein n=1 Tax=Symbiopectobacterium sp. TaxID=2952789 RepID=UPI0039EA68DE
MKIKQIALIGTIVTGIASTSAYSAPQQLPGYASGAEVIQIPVTRGQVDTLSNVVYSQIKGTRSVHQLKMSLLVPRTNVLKPAIVYFPGGGLISAEYEKYTEMRLALAQAGFVVAAAEYHVVPDTFPAPVLDGKAAVRYLRAHAAEYGIDPQRIGVLGDSARGYVAQMLGTTNDEKAFDKGENLDKSSDVQAVATLYGFSNLLNIGAGFPENIQEVHRSPASTEALLVHGAAFRDFPGAAIGKDEKKASYASPMGHINGKKPPFLIMHGSADTLVSPVQSAQLFKALKQGGNPAEYVLLEGANHGDLPWYQEPLIHRVVEWFKLTLKVAETQPTVTTQSNPNANL